VRRRSRELESPPPDIPDPQTFGCDARGDYTPSPQAIRAACDKIQKTWSPLTRARRGGLPVVWHRKGWRPRGWEPPIFATVRGDVVGVNE
jgi:hypothetical protein